jgi:hypothetical protein
MNDFPECAVWGFLVQLRRMLNFTRRFEVQFSNHARQNVIKYLPTHDVAKPLNLQRH